MSSAATIFGFKCTLCISVIFLWFEVSEFLSMLESILCILLTLFAVISEYLFMDHFKDFVNCLAIVPKSQNITNFTLNN